MGAKDLAVARAMGARATAPAAARAMGAWARLHHHPAVHLADHPAVHLADHLADHMADHLLRLHRLRMDLELDRPYLLLLLRPTLRSSLCYSRTRSSTSRR